MATQAGLGIALGIGLLLQFIGLTVVGFVYRDQPNEKDNDTKPGNQVALLANLIVISLMTVIWGSLGIFAFQSGSSQWLQSNLSGITYGSLSFAFVGAMALTSIATLISAKNKSNEDMKILLYSALAFQLCSLIGPIFILFLLWTSAPPISEGKEGKLTDIGFRVEKVDEGNAGKTQSIKQLHAKTTSPKPKILSTPEQQKKSRDELIQFVNRLNPLITKLKELTLKEKKNFGNIDLQAAGIEAQELAYIDAMTNQCIQITDFDQGPVAASQLKNQKREGDLPTLLASCRNSIKSKYGMTEVETPTIHTTGMDHPAQLQGQVPFIEGSTKYVKGEGPFILPILPSEKVDPRALKTLIRSRSPAPVPELYPVPPPERTTPAIPERDYPVSQVSQ